MRKQVTEATTDDGYFVEEDRLTWFIPRWLVDAHPATLVSYYNAVSIARKAMRPEQTGYPTITRPERSYAARKCNSPTNSSQRGVTDMPAMGQADQRQNSASVNSTREEALASIRPERDGIPYPFG